MKRGVSKPEKHARAPAQKAAREASVNHRARNSTINRKVKINLATLRLPEDKNGS